MLGFGFLFFLSFSFFFPSSQPRFLVHLNMFAKDPFHDILEQKLWGNLGFITFIN